ncbi:MAG: hypothetical protein ACI81R_001090 [Bradymonadia bacterium]
MTTIETDATCTVGVLEYQKFAEQFEPLIKQARTKRHQDAIIGLRAFLMGLGEGDRRDEAMVQLDRVDVAVQGNRWQSNAVGLILEASCVEQSEEVPDFMPLLDTCSSFFYEWNEEHAETIFTFFGFLSDHTLRWASQVDTWRAIVAPEMLPPVAEAMEGLSAREVRKMLIAAENGDVFSEDEAREFGRWWDAFRKAIRVATRLGEGLYVCVKVSEPNS